ncbi:hypothetical protein ACQY0O_001539 [Thecaphora frezii]
MGATNRIHYHHRVALAAVSSFPQSQPPPDSTKSRDKAAAVHETTPSFSTAKIKGAPSGKSNGSQVIFNGKRISDPVFLNGTTGVSSAKQRHRRKEGSLGQGGSASAAVSTLERSDGDSTTMSAIPPQLEQLFADKQACQPSTPERRHTGASLERLQCQKTPPRSLERLRIGSETQLKSKFSMSPDHRSRKGKVRLRERKVSPASPKGNLKRDESGIRHKSSMPAFSFTWSGSVRKDEKTKNPSQFHGPASKQATLIVPQPEEPCGIARRHGESLGRRNGASVFKRFL